MSDTTSGCSCCCYPDCQHDAVADQTPRLLQGALRIQPGPRCVSVRLKTRHVSAHCGRPRQQLRTKDGPHTPSVIGELDAMQAVQPPIQTVALEGCYINWLWDTHTPRACSREHSSHPAPPLSTRRLQKHEHQTQASNCDAMQGGPCARTPARKALTCAQRQTRRCPCHTQQAGSRCALLHGRTFLGPQPETKETVHPKRCAAVRWGAKQVSQTCDK